MSLPRNFLTVAVIGGLAISSVAMTAWAGSHAQNPAVGARQGHMRVMALNMGVLGEMARGNTDYDAETAQAAANNLLAMSTISQRFYWPEGTDNATIEGTRALPVLWSAESTAMAVGAEFATATQGLAAVAGDGLDAMRTALGPVGSACGSCHDDNRAEN